LGRRKRPGGARWQRVSSAGPSRGFSGSVPIRPWLTCIRQKARVLAVGSGPSSSSPKSFKKSLIWVMRRSLLVAYGIPLDRVQRIPPPKESRARLITYRTGPSAKITPSQRRQPGPFPIAPPGWFKALYSPTSHLVQTSLKVAGRREKKKAARTTGTAHNPKPARQGGGKGTRPCIGRAGV
jgi:hypothetical protein